MVGILRLIFIALVMLPATLVMAPVQILAMWFHRPLARTLPLY